MNNYSAFEEKKRFGFRYAVGAVLLLLIGFVLGIMWMGMRYPILKEPGFNQFNAVYTRVANDYLEETNPKQLIDGATQGMVASLDDPYSQYLTGEQGEAYTQSYEGQFYGIGAELRQEESRFVIQSVIKDTPAERGGLLPGDIIVAVDGEDLTGKSFQQLLSVVRGEEGTSVTLRLLRAGENEPLELTLQRAAIPVHTVKSEMLAGGIGHVTISRFAENTAKEFKAELEKLEEQEPLKGLLLDLRSNPGGLLEPTLNIANTLIPKDAKILDVVYRNERRTVSFVSHQEKEWTVPIAVLVNNRSASASEVIAAALKESAGAVVIGEQTFGKGVVQAFNQFPDRSVLTLTEAQWKTPGGTWINKEGVTPDHIVALPDYASLRPLPLGAEMKRGSYGDDVKTLQTMLRELGYTPINDDGLFNEQTEAALARFQRNEGLEETGLFNDKTGYRLVELLREKLDAEDTQLMKGIELLNQ